MSRKKLVLEVLLLFLGCTGCTSGKTNNGYKWREGYYEGMPLDHFHRNSTSKFDLRYLINDTWWDPNGGPILFYVGNEGMVEEFARNTGLMWEWAPQFRAMLVFAEHRFYGKTMPFGNNSFTMPNLETLTVDQAMEDFAVLLKRIKQNTTGAQNSSVIAVGGSYGGTLAAWMRLKYPELIQGAIASSAPVKLILGTDLPCWSFGAGVTRTYAKTNPQCVDAIRRSWVVLGDMLETDEGRMSLMKTFRMCDYTQIEFVPILLDRINDALQYMAMFDYPYETDFVVPLPAWPVKEACKYFTADAPDNDTLISNIFEAVSIFFNHTGTLECFSLRFRLTESFAMNWAYQTCTELVFPICSNGSGVLLEEPWDEQGYHNRCSSVYEGSQSKGDYINRNYGLAKLKTASMILFTNSELDPWFSGGISPDDLEGTDPTLIAISILNAAHHYELRPSHPNDTREVIEVRDRMKSIVQSWLVATDSDPSTNAGSSNEISWCSILVMGWCMIWMY